RNPRPPRVEVGAHERPAEVLGRVADGAGQLPGQVARVMRDASRGAATNSAEASVKHSRGRQQTSCRAAPGRIHGAGCHLRAAVEQNDASVAWFSSSAARTRCKINMRNQTVQ